MSTVDEFASNFRWIWCLSTVVIWWLHLHYCHSILDVGWICTTVMWQWMSCWDIDATMDAESRWWWRCHRLQLKLIQEHSATICTADFQIWTERICVNHLRKSKYWNFHGRCRRIVDTQSIMVQSHYRLCLLVVHSQNYHTLARQASGTARCVCTTLTTRWSENWRGFSPTAKTSYWLVPAEISVELRGRRKVHLGS